MKKITYLFVYFFFIISMSVCETPPGSPTYATTSTTSLTTKKTILSRIGISAIPNSSRELLNAFIKLLDEFAVLHKDNAVLEKDKAILQKDYELLQKDKENEMAILQKDYAILQKDYELLEKDKEKDKAILKNEMAILKNEMELLEKDKEKDTEKDKELFEKEKEKDKAALKEKLEEKKKESMVLRSLAICRSWIDDAEELMLINFPFPTKDVMIKNLTDHKSQDYFLIQSKEKLGSFKPYSSIHTVQWFYYLMYCQSKGATMIRDVINGNNISVSDFCDGVGIIHGKMNMKIPHISYSLSDEEIIKGLQFSRIMKKEVIPGFVQVLEEIRSGPVLFTGIFTTIF